MYDVVTQFDRNTSVIEEKYKITLERTVKGLECQVKKFKLPSTGPSSLRFQNKGSKR